MFYQYPMGGMQFDALFGIANRYFGDYQCLSSYKAPSACWSSACDVASVTAGRGDGVKGQRPLRCCLPLLSFHCSRSSIGVAFSLERRPAPPSSCGDRSYDCLPFQTGRWWQVAGRGEQTPSNTELFLLILRVEFSKVEHRIQFTAYSIAKVLILSQRHLTENYVKLQRNQTWWGRMRLLWMFLK